MGVAVKTLYTVTCDYCWSVIVEGHADLNHTVSLAIARAGHRYDRKFGPADVWECNNCRARRVVAEELRESRNDSPAARR